VPCQGIGGFGRIVHLLVEQTPAGPTTDKLYFGNSGRGPVPARRLRRRSRRGARCACAQPKSRRCARGTWCDFGLFRRSEARSCSSRKKYQSRSARPASSDPLEPNRARALFFPGVRGRGEAGEAGDPRTSGISPISCGMAIHRRRCGACYRFWAKKGRVHESAVRVLTS
jgi:hypothetical protein